ncbi:4597_t:CDS:10 [Diversispora eburnea]|uniref:4597_t:CDS:1 n=1 Tax=Diversispora eburnea TaxID=1213867 RepID=A0A9N9AL72_9GLOM|nr:4597_t:CDS:10 [Diversispora eburnea]
MESSFLAMGKASIWDIGTFSFRKQITSNMVFNKRLLGGFIMNVKKMREGDQINETSFKNSIQMFKVLKLYSILEKVILYESAKFYEQQSKILFLNGNVHEYLYYVRQRMKFEGEKMAPYFQIKTKDSLLKLVKSELIDKNADIIWKMFEQSFVTENVMLTDNKFRAQSLKSLYYFLVNMDSIELLQILIGSYYEGNLAFIKNAHDWYGLVNSLVQLKGEINTIVEGDYEDENSILKIKETWHRRIGKFVSENVTIIEFIANVINEFMRTPENSPEVWQKFEQNLTNFLSCMEDKTIFRVLYTSDLIKRLLFNETSGLEYERHLGNIISAWMEEGFSKKLDIMLEDMNTSKKINNSFRNSHCELDVNVNILTLNNWPNYLTNFVSSMLSIKNAFNNIIARENNNKLKVLKWHHGLDRCIVEATYPKGTIQVDLSLHSTLILLLFNDLKTVSKLSYKEIKNSINLGEAFEPSFHIITNTDRFYINERLLLNDLKMFNGTPITIHDLEVNKKFKEVQGVRITRQIAEYRAIQLESLIMKIIKPEKKIHINELIDRVLSHPRFDWAMVNMYLKIDEKYLIYLP